MTQPLSYGGGSSSLANGEERRRSQRVVIRVPVTLVYVVAGKNVKLAASTVSVNDHGAMLLCPQTMAAKSAFELQNDRTRETVKCRVVRTPVESAEGHMVPVEFTRGFARFLAHHLSSHQLETSRGVTAALSHPSSKPIKPLQL